MSEIYLTYLLCWGSACIVAIVLMIKRRKNIELFHRAYWLGLAQGWKVITFLIAASLLTVVAPYTIDPTWDYIDALFMSILTYTTAPWAVSTLYLALQRKRKFDSIFIAVCIWMFSVSWSYDAYILLRDGNYPPTWLPNIFLSSIMYLAAGLFWSLEYVADRGVIFGFMQKNWPHAPSYSKFSRIVWYTLPFIILVTAMVLPFLLKK